MKIFVATIAGWCAGVSGSWLYLFQVHSGEPHMGGDFHAAVVAATVGAMLMVPIIYWPLVRSLRDRRASIWVFAIGCAVLCVLPWLVVGGLWGGPAVILTVASPEAQFVYAIFLPFGAVFGAVCGSLDRLTAGST